MCFHLATDGLTPRSGDSYVCVTAHMMDSDFTPHVYAIVCKSIPQEHAVQNAAQFQRDVIEDYGHSTTSDLPYY